MVARKKTVVVLDETKMKGIVLEHCGLKGSPTRVISTYVPTAKKTDILLKIRMDRLRWKN